ncbi:MAG: hypothetical protein HYY93_00115 [Planctomycetes bacterium]|nr:hypothetical protein [Planctomycetota bacterium]
MSRILKGLVGVGASLVVAVCLSGCLGHSHHSCWGRQGCGHGCPSYSCGHDSCGHKTCGTCGHGYGGHSHYCPGEDKDSRGNTGKTRAQEAYESYYQSR